jgi:hypothetical protein
VGPRAVLDAVVKRKIPSPRWESKPRTPIVQPVANNKIYFKGLGYEHMDCIHVNMDVGSYGHGFRKRVGNFLTIAANFGNCCMEISVSFHNLRAGVLS